MSVKVNMIRRLSKILRSDSLKPLIENNNNNNILHDGYDMEGNGYNGPMAPGIFSLEEEKCPQPQVISLQDLAEILQVAPDAVSCSSSDNEEQVCLIVPPEPTQKNRKQVVHLMQISAMQHFPKPPADLNQNLMEHLEEMHKAMFNELVRLGPLLDSLGLTECLIECYHCQMFTHLDNLLPNISSAQNFFLLMDWVQKVYQSQELLGHPDFQDLDLIKKVDPQLLTAWQANATKHLLEKVQEEVRKSLENILQNERTQERCDTEEDYVGLYVDTIQCVAAMPNYALKISSQLSDQVQEVCFQQLLIFVKRYSTEQTNSLERKAKMDKPQTIHFFKTLKTCKELKQHFEPEGEGIRTSLLKGTAETLEVMETFTVKLLMDTAAKMTEKHLKAYFKTHNKQFSVFLDALKSFFPEPTYCQDVRETVMGEAYEIIVRIYIKRLIKTRKRNLKKHWSPDADVGDTVAKDAQLLHDTILALAPEVRNWNHLLLNIKEVLDCTNTETIKIPVAIMQQKWLTNSREDLLLLRTLLQWKGLSRRDVKKVLAALPSDHQTRARSRPWYCCLNCYCGPQL
ncbi:exocyst complex component 3-like protein 4 [Mastacembelus armatus]|uniref:exocyst complex component 3-like protein 4 n=1 Tax=Mastacembelus armatus TaxID=205130 RepID=UPI000E45BE34|nr:exocyst complex component 3-like protein 4 [Mastacembelus armatus]